MARITYTPKAHRLLDANSSKADRENQRFAFLIFEAARRAALLGEDVRTSADFDDTLMEIVEKTNAGEEPPRIQEVIPSREERNMLKALGRGKTKEERKEIRLSFESDVILKEAEKIAPRVREHGERQAQERRVNYPFARRRALEVMLQKFEKDIGLDREFMTGLREAIFEPGEKYAALVHRYEPRQVAPDDIEIEADKAPFVVDLQETRWHRFNKEDRTAESPQFITECGIEISDIGETQRGRMLQLIHFATMAEGTTSVCEECWPDLETAPEKVRPGKFGLHVDDTADAFA